MFKSNFIKRCNSALKAFNSRLCIPQSDVVCKEKAFKSRPFRVSVEGNIGSGKSTFIKHFAERPNVDTYMEPVEKWRNVQGHNLLGLLYEDISRWNFVFERYVQLTRLNIQTGLKKNNVQIFERSLQNNRYCFVEMARDNHQLSEPEYVVLCEWFDWINTHMDIDLDLIVYLQTSPKVVYNRIKKRNRPEEATIPLDYLEKLHAAYEKWLFNSENSPARVLCINADQDLDTVKQLYQKYERLILGEEQ